MSFHWAFPCLSLGVSVSCDWAFPCAVTLCFRVWQLLDGQQEGSEGRGTNTADEFVFLKSRLNGGTDSCGAFQADPNRTSQVGTGVAQARPGQVRS